MNKTELIDKLLHLGNTTEMCCSTDRHNAKELAHTLIDEYLEEKLRIGGVGISAYLMDIDNEATIVLANNISDALDKAHNVAEKDYEMTYSKSLPVMH